MAWAAAAAAVACGGDASLAGAEASRVAAAAACEQGQRQDRHASLAGGEASRVVAAAGATVLDLLIYIYIYTYYTLYLSQNIYYTYCILIAY